MPDVGAAVTQAKDKVPPPAAPQHTHESALLLQFAVAAAANIASHLQVVELEKENRKK